MKKIDNKIYSTQDYQVNVLLTVVPSCFLLFITAFYTAMLIEWFDGVLLVFAIAHILAFFVWMLWYLVKVVALLKNSKNYEYCWAENFVIQESDEILRRRYFAVKVAIDGEFYISDKIITANLFAIAQQNKKLEIGLNKAKGTIVVVKPL